MFNCLLQSVIKRQTYFIVFTIYLYKWFMSRFIFNHLLSIALQTYRPDYLCQNQIRYPIIRDLILCSLILYILNSKENWARWLWYGGYTNSQRIVTAFKCVYRLCKHIYFILFIYNVLNYIGFTRKVSQKFLKLVLSILGIV